MALETIFSALAYFITLGVLTFFIGLVGTKAFISVMREQKILAKPNERSMHTEPVPTGAGWVIVLITIDRVYCILSSRYSSSIIGWFPFLHSCWRWCPGMTIKLSYPLFCVSVFMGPR